MCQNMGRALNNVVKTTVTLMDEGKVSKEAAKTIINRCFQLGYWCDDVDSEATDYIKHCMCGRCMKKVPKGEKLYSIFDAPSAIWTESAFVDQLVTRGLCKECFDIIVNEYCKDENAGELERLDIERNHQKRDYTSTGKYDNYLICCK